MHGDVVDRLTMMGEALLHLPIRQQHRAVWPLLDNGTGHALLLARTRGVDDHGLVALLDGEFGRAHERCLAAHADQWRIQRMVGDQP